MANLPESSVFDAGVYQIETTDPVIGGPNGVTNTPLKNLTNRTRFLKEKVDQVLADFAPKASPVFSGSPVAPTPPQFDNDTSIATTEFVRRQGMQHSSVEVVSVSKTIGLSGIGGNVIAYGNAAPITFTLPAATSCPSGACISFFNASLFDVTISAPGTDKINPSLNAVQSIVLSPGETISLTLYGDYWEAYSGTGNIKHLPSFAGAVGNTAQGGFGYQKLPSGIIIQWGTYAGAVPVAAAINMYYPISFTQGVYSVVATIAQAASGNYPAITAVNYGWLDRFILRNNGTYPGSDFGWIAIGK